MVTLMAIIVQYLYIYVCVCVYGSIYSRVSPPVQYNNLILR